MPTLKEVAKYVRSKNAGPFWMTIDIFCENDESFCRIQNSPNFTPEAIAKTYSVTEASVKSFYIENLRVIKFSFPRPQIQGNKYEKDMHAGQQYLRLMDISV